METTFRNLCKISVAFVSPMVTNLVIKRCAMEDGKSFFKFF